MLLDIRKKGLEAKIISGNYKIIKENIDKGAPPIAMIELPSKEKHYCVIVGYKGESPSEIIVHDGLNAFKSMNREKFDSYWQKTAYSMIVISN